jgi:4-amino-4-deoxy-L-arabinose transferase-like glycosyltransferase
MGISPTPEAPSDQQTAPRALPGTSALDAWSLTGRAVPVLAGVAAVLTLVSTRNGPGITPDSVSYLAAARHLAAGDGFRDFTGDALTTFPPGYPALLALGDAIGLDISVWARIVNAAAAAGLVALTWVSARRHVAVPTLALLATCLVTFSRPLHVLASRLWSDTLFLLCCMAFLLLMETALARRQSRAAMLAAAGAVCGVAFLLRYAGAGLVIAGGIVLLLALRRHGLRDLLRAGLAFGLPAAIAPCVLLVRNAGTGSRDLLGPRIPNGRSAGEELGVVLRSLADTFAPAQSLHWLFYGTVVLLGLGVLLRRAKVTRARGPEPAPGDALTLVTWVVAYTAFVIVADVLSSGSLSIRILAPVYVPVIVLTAKMVARALPRVHTGRAGMPPQALLRLDPGRWVVAGAAGLGLVWLGLAVAWAGSYASKDVASLEYGATSGWNQSELSQQVRSVEPGALVVGNNPFAAYLWGHHEPVAMSPGRMVPEQSLWPMSTTELTRRATCSPPVYLAWFDITASSGIEPPESLTDDVRLTVVASTADGTLYRVDPEAADLQTCR